MAGPFDDLIGELKPGEKGWLPLDESGNPTGPATLIPEPPPALACRVYANPKDPLEEDDDALLSATGAPLEAPLNPTSDNRVDVPDTEDPNVAPVISTLSPATAIANDPTDIEMIVDGTGFTAQSTIVFNGFDEPTDYISPTQVRTGVRPSLFEVPADCPVEVRNGTGISNSLTFSFTAAARNTRR